jgi:Rha family phage regulatory protein
MSQSIIGASAPIVSISNNTVVTTSMAVAEAFGKSHKDILRAISGLLAVLPDEHKRNFAPMFLDVEIGNGAVRKSTSYEITRDGFSLLAMGFTGRKALEFKLAYIDALTPWNPSWPPATLMRSASCHGCALNWWPVTRCTHVWRATMLLGSTARKSAP